MRRLFFLTFACVFLVLAVIGIFLPGIPTVPFVLLAAWFSARGSERLHRWLYQHPHLGKILIQWETEGAISRGSKITAVSMLILSVVLMYHRFSNPWLLACVTVLLLLVAIYLISRPEPK